MTYVERAERRRQIAEACKDRFIEDVMMEFRVGDSTARDACRTHRVQYRRYPKPKVFSSRVLGAAKAHSIKRAFKVVRLSAERRTDASIGRECELSRERVRQIKAMAIEAGLLTG